MTTTLVAVICAGMLCQDVVVPTEEMVAGKVTDPVPMQYTMVMCKANGDRMAQDWLRQQQQYQNWRVTKVKCVPGRYVVPNAA